MPLLSRASNKNARGPAAAELVLSLWDSDFSNLKALLKTQLLQARLSSACYTWWAFGFQCPFHISYSTNFNAWLKSYWELCCSKAFSLFKSSQTENHSTSNHCCQYHLCTASSYPYDHQIKWLQNLSASSRRCCGHCHAYGICRVGFLQTTGSCKVTVVAFFTFNWYQTHLRKGHSKILSCESSITLRIRPPPKVFIFE